MAKTYFAQSDAPATTMTVGQLIERLQGLDPSAQVVFQSPPHGSYGPRMAYTIDDVAAVALDRHEHVTPARTEVDEETGEEIRLDEDVQVFHAWQGVVIS